MGDRHNRKRTRHRPIRRQRLCQQLEIVDNNTAPISLSPSDQQPSTYPCSCWHPSTRQLPPSKPSLHQTIKPQCTPIAKPNPAFPITHLPETIQSRTRRVFGGVESSDDDESTELCAPMLDVVLALFGGIDYDDDDDGAW
ncbi:hypothetical protein Q7P35_001815 [Cladosporium inversicolor]